MTKTCKNIKYKTRKDYSKTYILQIAKKPNPFNIKSQNKSLFKAPVKQHIVVS